MTNKIECFVDRDVHSILGLPFDSVSLDGAIAIVRKSIEQDASCFLSTPNLNFVIATQADDAFFQSIVDSDLSVADGMPLIWVAKLLGIPIAERVAGSTLFDELSKQKNKAEKINVFFFGGQEGIAELAHQKLNENSLGSISSIVKPLSGQANFDENITFSIFLNFFGRVSFSYSTNNRPSDKLSAVSTLSANLFPNSLFIIILSTITEMSCLIFLFYSGTSSIL